MSLKSQKERRERAELKNYSRKYGFKIPKFGKRQEHTIQEVQQL